MPIKLSDIPEETIDEYNLQDKSSADGSLYTEITRGIYGLPPQAGLLVNKLLEKRLNKHGYQKSKNHDCQPIQFTLVVEDFGVKYVNKEYANHLTQA